MGLLRDALGELVAARMEDLRPMHMRRIVPRASLSVGANDDGTWGVCDGAETYGPFCSSGATVTKAVDCLLRRIEQEQQ